MTESKEEGLGKAYARALDLLTESHGYEVSLLVKSVVIAKIMSAKFRTEIDKHIDDIVVCEKLEELVISVISDVIATMCTLQNKEFKKDIIPLVNEVMGGDGAFRRNLQ